MVMLVILVGWSVAHTLPQFYADAYAQPMESVERHICIIFYRILEEWKLAKLSLICGYFLLRLLWNFILVVVWLLVHMWEKVEPSVTKIHSFNIRCCRSMHMSFVDHRNTVEVGYIWQWFSCIHLMMSAPMPTFEVICRSENARTQIPRSVSSTAFARRIVLFHQLSIFQIKFSHAQCILLVSHYAPLCLSGNAPEDETLLYCATHEILISLPICCILQLFPGFGQALPTFLKFFLYGNPNKDLDWENARVRPSYVKVFWKANDIYSVGLEFRSFNVFCTCDTEDF